MTERNPRHVVRETWRGGNTFYDVTRCSWEGDGAPVILRSFLTRREADKWVRDIERRQDVITKVVDGYPAGPPLVHRVTPLAIHRS